MFSNWYHTPPEVCSQKFATLIGREKIRLCNREEKCALTEVVYSTGVFMRQCKNVCKNTLINICMRHHVILVVPPLRRAAQARGTTASRDRHLAKPRRHVFLFLRAYDLTSSHKPFRSKTPRKPLCLYLKTADKVTDLLLRSGRTSKLSVSGNLRNT